MVRGGCELAVEGSEQDALAEPRDRFLAQEGGSELYGIVGAQPVLPGEFLGVSEERVRNPAHPGESLRGALAAEGWTMTEAAEKLGCTRQTFSRLLNGRTGISPAMALESERIGWSNAAFWMRPQGSTISRKNVHGLIAAQWWPFGSDESADLRVENQRLRSESESLARQNERLSTEKENIEERLMELLIKTTGQEALALENVRLTGELERARIDLAEESARREGLQESIEEERRARLRIEQLLDNGSDLNRDTGSSGWLGWLAALALASALLWREWFRSKTILTATLRRVVRRDTDAIARQVTDVTPVERSRDHRAS